MKNTTMVKIIKIDLHGFTIHEAWKYFRSSMKEAYFQDRKSITVVTGHGVMSKEIEGWCEADPYVVSCKRQDPNTGAWTICLIKKKKVKEENTILNLTGLYKKWNKK